MNRLLTEPLENNYKFWVKYKKLPEDSGDWTKGGRFWTGVKLGGTTNMGWVSDFCSFTLRVLGQADKGASGKWREIFRKEKAWEGELQVLCINSAQVPS